MNVTARRLRWALGLTGVALLLLVGYIGYQAQQARDDFDRMADDVRTLSDQISSGDVDGARATLRLLQTHASEARAHTHGPAWWLVERVPVLGANVTAVGAVAEAADDVAQDSLPPFLEAADLLKPENLRPSGSRIGIQGIEQAQPLVFEGTTSLEGNVAAIQRIDRDGLVPALQDAVADLQDHLEQGLTYARRLSLGVQLLPGMLGSDGPRSYLLIVENNAELRSGGGIAGAFAEIRVNAGHLRLVRQGSSTTVGYFESPVVKTTPEEDALLGPRFALFPQNVTQSLDFSRTAEVAREMWHRSTGSRVDGVLSIDPVALSYLLRGLGPVTAPDGTEVTADNVVDLLLNRIYLETPDPAAQDVFFAGFAKAVFDAIASGAGDSKQVLSGLIDATEEGRVHVWSAVSAEESLLADTRLAGLVRSWSDGHPEVGVYFNESTASKMDYYLRAKASLNQSRCRSETQRMRLTLRLTNTLRQPASSLPAYVAGQPGNLFPPGTILLTIYVLAPVDGSLDKGLVDGEAGAINYVTYAGRSVGAQTIPIDPGQTRVVSFQVEGGSGAVLDPRLVMTPGAWVGNAASVEPSPCSGS